ncbi:MAG TPA: hypothetical protein VMW01_05395 [Williamwhitmania sp.]|nr:hypothetical protein [Williamwhitmania sp.]
MSNNNVTGLFNKTPKLMTKGKKFFVSILLIVAGVLIEFLLKDCNTNLDKELVDFFAGILLGSGGSILIMTLFKKRR